MDISENVTWGQRKRFADGKVSFAYSRFLGLSLHSIAVELTGRGIKTPGGKDVWDQQTVRRMLSNEKT